MLYAQTEPLAINLDNDSDAIPVDSDYRTVEAVSLETNVSMYYGGKKEEIASLEARAYSDMSCTSEVLSAVVSVADSKVRVSLPKGEVYASTVYVLIAASCANGSRSIMFTLTPQASGAPGVSPIIYQLSVSPNALSFTRDSSGNLVDTAYSLAFNVKRTEGGQTGIVAAPIADMYVYAGYNNSIDYASSYAVGSSLRVASSDAESNTDLLVELWQGEYPNGKRIDRESIPIVKDGSKGEDAESPLVMDLDNEIDAIPVDSNYAIVQDKTLQTNVSMFYGLDRQTLTALTAKACSDAYFSNEVSTVVVSCNVGTGNVSVTFKQGDTYASSVFVLVTASCESGSRSAVFTLTPQASGAPGVSPIIYQLSPNPSSLAFGRDSDGNIVSAVYGVSANVKRSEGNETSIISTALAGFYIYIGYDGALSYATSYNVGDTINVTTNEAKRYSYLQMELWRGVYGNGNCIDRESVPLVKDGNKGSQGDQGPQGEQGNEGPQGPQGEEGPQGPQGNEGNGIVTDDFYYQLTATIVPPSVMPTQTGSLWVKQGDDGCPFSPTNIQPYLWQCEHIAYSSNSSLNKDVVKLVAVANINTMPQLLEATSFDSEEVMSSKWDVMNGEVIPQARGMANAFGTFPNLGSMTNVLRQKVYSPEGLAKIEPSNYYTLSFYARTRRYINLTATGLAFATKQVYLNAGTYQLQMCGRCSQQAVSEGIELTAYLFSKGEDGVWTSSVKAITTSSTDEVVYSTPLDVSDSGVYYVAFYARKSDGSEGSDAASVTVNWYRIMSCYDNNILSTFLYPSALAKSQTYFVDGLVKVHNSSSDWDGNVQWALNDAEEDSLGWSFHSVTFQTKSGIPSVEQYVLFRAYNSYVEICRPKLEKCVMATEWCEHEYDSSTECSHNPSGNWKTGTTYYYCNGQRDVVRAQIDAGTMAQTWFRLRRRTSSAGYVSYVQPYLDTEHWEKGNNLKFSIVEAMFADEIFTDKLTVAKIRGYNNSFSVDENGDVVCNNGTFSNIKVSGSGDFTGFVRKRATVITPGNITRYIVDEGDSSEAKNYRIDFLKTGSFIIFNNDESDTEGVGFEDFGKVNVTLPSCMYTTDSAAMAFDPAMLYVGSTAMICVCATNLNLTIKGLTTNTEVDGYIGTNSTTTLDLLPISSEGKLLFLRCFGAPCNNGTLAQRSGYAVAWSYKQSGVSTSQGLPDINTDPWTLSPLPPNIAGPYTE